MEPPKTNAKDEWERYTDHIASEIFIRRTSAGNRMPPAEAHDQAKNFVSTIKKRRK